jgi:predicted PurR-regulated permease PerM
MRIGFASLFGMLGMVLASPLTAAALRISRELVRAKAQEAALEQTERRPPSPNSGLFGAALSTGVFTG